MRTQRHTTATVPHPPAFTSTAWREEVRFLPSCFFRGDGSSSESADESSSCDETGPPHEAPARYDSSYDDDGAPVKRVAQTQPARLAQRYASLLTKSTLHIYAGAYTAVHGYKE